jgi:hypothetical protein
MVQNADQLPTHRQRTCSSAPQQLITCRRVAAHTPIKPQEKEEMEPFRVDVPDEVLNDLQARLKLTRWADDFANED